MSRKDSRTLVLSLVLIVLLANVALAAPTVPGAVYSDQGAAGSNKPVVQIQYELEMAGIKDVQPTDWYAGSITVVVQAGLLKPEPDGNFHPEADLQNFDGVSVFAKVLGIANKNDPPFMALSKMKSAGLVSDFTVGDKDMTRIEVARLLGKALGIAPKTGVDASRFPFADFGAFGNDYDRGIMAALYEAGIFKGYEDGTFRPLGTLTKAEICILVDRILGSR